MFTFCPPEANRFILLCNRSYSTPTFHSHSIVYSDNNDNENINFMMIISKKAMLNNYTNTTYYRIKRIVITDQITKPDISWK